MSVSVSVPTSEGGKANGQGLGRGPNRNVCAAVVCFSRVLQPCASAVCCSRVLQSCAAAVCCSRVLQPCAAAVCCSRVLQSCAAAVCCSRVLHLRSCGHVVKKVTSQRGSVWILLGRTGSSIFSLRSLDLGSPVGACRASPRSHPAASENFPCHDLKLRAGLLKMLLAPCRASCLPSVCRSPKIWKTLEHSP